MSGASLKDLLNRQKEMMQAILAMKARIDNLGKALTEARSFAFAAQLTQNETMKLLIAVRPDFDPKAWQVEHMEPMLLKHGFKVLSPDELKARQQRIVAERVAAGKMPGLMSVPTGDAALKAFAVPAAAATQQDMTDKVLTAEEQVARSALAASVARDHHSPIPVTAQIRPDQLPSAADGELTTHARSCGPCTRALEGGSISEGLGLCAVGHAIYQRVLNNEPEAEELKPLGVVDLGPRSRFLEDFQLHADTCQACRAAAKQEAFDYEDLCGLGAHLWKTYVEAAP